MSGTEFHDARRILSGAARVVVLSGAGMSAESGVPTFRDALTGLWENHDPTTLATPEAWHRDPSFVWRWYQMRRRMVGDAQPNEGHLAIARCERVVEVVTQNVDDLHERAGSSSVRHVHGELFANRCDTCGHPHPDPVDPATDDLVDCGLCDGRLRPGVVWFSEMLPTGPWEAALTAVRTCDVALVVGTSGLVHPAASLPGLAAEHGATVVEVNPGDSGLGGVVDVHVTDTAGRALPRLLD